MLTVFTVENLPSTALPIALSISLLALLSFADLAKVFWETVTDRTRAKKMVKIIDVFSVEFMFFLKKSS
jgi:hypothetical protein